MRRHEIEASTGLYTRGKRTYGLLYESIHESTQDLVQNPIYDPIYDSTRTGWVMQEVSRINMRYAY